MGTAAFHIYNVDEMPDADLELLEAFLGMQEQESAAVEAETKGRRG